MTYNTTLIYNPAAGPWDMTRPLKRLGAYLNRSGWRVELVETSEAGDATRKAREAAERREDIVLIAGGDGTINEAANGVSNTDTVLGIVPVGTGNILARQLRMPVLSVVAPLYVREVGDALLRSKVQRVDTGLVNGRNFVCWTGCGLDAEIASQMEPRPRHLKRLGKLPYIIAGLSVASEYRGARSSLVIEDRVFRTRALLTVISNIQLYAAFFHIAPHARMDDGLLDVFVFKGLGLSYVFRYLLQALGRDTLQSPDILHALAAHMEVETTPSVAVHVDGDPYGSTPAQIAVRPGALRLLVPPNAPQSLFSKPPEAF